ncbi:MAG: hypothetical protein QXU18_15265, partial [Thermoplasmatales archaeon]
MKRDGSITATIDYSELGKYYTDSLEGRELFEGKYIRQNKKKKPYKKEDFLSVNNPQEIEIKKFLKDLKVKNLKLGMIRYAAGGAIPVLKIKKKQYVLMIRKSKDASVHGEHLTTASGLSEKWEEILNPTLLIGREFLEEVIIFDRNLQKHFNVIISASKKPKKKQMENTREPEKDKDFYKYLSNYDDYFGEISGNGLKEIPYPKKYQRLIKFIGNKNVEEVEIEGKVIPLGNDRIELSKKLKKEIGRKIKNKLKGPAGNKIIGKVIIDSAYGAVDLIGAVKISFGEEISGPEDIRILDFDTDEKSGKFLRREMFLVDLRNLKKLINGECFDCSIYSVSSKPKNNKIKSNKIVANYNLIKGHYECPALSPPLRGSLDACYNKLSKKKKKNIEFKYDASQQFLVDSVTQIQENDHNKVSYGQIA